MKSSFKWGKSKTPVRKVEEVSIERKLLISISSYLIANGYEVITTGQNREYIQIKDGNFLYTLNVIGEDYLFYDKKTWQASEVNAIPTMSPKYLNELIGDIELSIIEDGRPSNFYVWDYIDFDMIDNDTNEPYFNKLVPGEGKSFVRLEYSDVTDPRLVKLGDKLKSKINFEPTTYIGGWFDSPMSDLIKMLKEMNIQAKKGCHKWKDIYILDDNAFG